MNELHNKVIVSVIKAKDGKISTRECRNLRTDIGVNWQAMHSIGDVANEPARNLAISSRATAPVSGDTDLKGELAGNGLSRITGTYSHTADQSLATLSATWKYTGGSTVTVTKAAVATAPTDLGTSADTHFLITAVSPVAVLDSNDTLAIDWGVNF
jgi:hypothetical protein